MKRGLSVTVIVQGLHEDGSMSYYQGQLDEDDVGHVQKLMSLGPMGREKLVNTKKDSAEAQVLHKIFEYVLEDDRLVEEDVRFQGVSDKDLVQYMPCYFVVFNFWD